MEQVLWGESVVIGALATPVPVHLTRSKFQMGVQAHCR